MKIVRFFRAHQRLLFALASLVFIVGGTILALKWAQGYRLSLRRGTFNLSDTGLLVAESDPKGAQVFINGKLTTATDDTLNLPPSSYDVEIRKDGFTTWKKTLTIQEGLVDQTATKLFPSVPDLSPLTFTSASNPLPSPDGQKIAYKVSAASSDAKNGLWVVELADRNLPVARASAPKQIARNSSQYNFLDATLAWTPDSNQLLAYWTEDQGLKDKGKKTTSGASVKGGQISIRIAQAVLLSTSGMNDEAEIRDATSRLPVLIAGWHQDLDLSDKDRLKRLPSFMLDVATSSATAVHFSPDEFKLLYVAIANRSIPPKLIPDIPSESTQKEEREIQTGGIYVYDLKEDRNYRVGDVTDKRTKKPSPPTGVGAQSNGSDFYWADRLSRDEIHADLSEPAENSTFPPVPISLLANALDVLQQRYSPVFELPLQWFPTSRHLLKHENNRVSIMEYDGTNNATIYAGPLDESFAYPWPNGNRVIILTTLNEGAPENLYTIGLQ